MANHCQGKNQQGQPCLAYVADGHEWCQWHDPARIAERRVWSQKGGRNRSNRARARKEAEAGILTPRDLPAVLSRVVHRLESGAMEPNVGNAIASVAKALLAVQDSVMVDERLAELEKRAGIVRLSDRRAA